MPYFERFTDPARQSQPSQPYEKHTELLLRRLVSIRSRSRGALWAEDVAVLTIAHVELVAHDRIEQRVGAVKQLAVDYRV